MKTAFPSKIRTDTGCRVQIIQISTNKTVTLFHIPDISLSLPVNKYMPAQ